jgi:hypothetical protein
MKAGTTPGAKAGTEAEREWAALAIAALFTALAGLAVSTMRDPWYLTLGIVTAFGVFLVAAAMFVFRLTRHHAHPDL